jgi:hypothetical protein
MAVQGKGVIIHGLTELNHALERIDGPGNFGLDYELSRRLRNIGESVARVASGNVTHRTGRHGDASQPRLEDTIKVSVTKRRASVYSTSIYGGAQQFGAGPKAGWANRGPHIRADRASKFMSKAVASQRDFIAEEADGLLDWLAKEIDRD